jgi:DNA-binding response OmpR family regulator
MEQREDATIVGGFGRQPARIFLGEDDQEMRSLMVAALRHAGHQVIAESNGLDLLRSIQSRKAMVGSSRHDLVVTDVHMPGATGIEVLATVRRSQPGLPVLLVTAFGDADLRAAAADLGAAAIFDKPFTMVALHTAVSRLVGTGSVCLPSAEGWDEMPDGGNA